MKSQNTKVLKHGLTLGAAQYIAQMLNILRTFVAANLLGPTYFGLWNKFLFYLNYVQYLNLGTDLHVNREISQNLNSIDHKIVLSLLKTYIKFFMQICFLFSILLIIFTVFNFTNTAKDKTFLFYTIIFLYSAILSTLIYRFVNFITLAYGLFYLAGIYRVINAAINLVFVFLLCKAYGLYGMYLAFLISTILPIIFISIIFRKNIFKIYRLLKNTVNTIIYKNFLLQSFSLVSINFLVMFWVQYDRFFITLFYNNLDAGYYFFASNIVQSVVVIISSFATVLYQKMNVSFGDGESKQEMFLYISKVIQYLNLLLPITLIIIFYLSPYIFGLFFKKYIPSIIYLKFLLVGALFLSQIMILYVFYTSLRNQQKFGKSLLIAFFISSIFYLLLGGHFSMYYYPLVVIVTNYLLCVYLFLKARSLCLSKMKIFKSLYTLSSPIVLASFSVFIVDFMFDNILFRIICSLVFYLAFCFITKDLFIHKISLAFIRGRNKSK